MDSHNVSLKLKPNSAPELTRTLDMEIIPTVRKQNLYKDKK